MRLSHCESKEYRAPKVERRGSHPHTDYLVSNLFANRASSHFLHLTNLGVEARISGQPLKKLVAQARVKSDTENPLLAPR